LLFRNTTSEVRNEAKFLLFMKDYKIDQSSIIEYGVTIGSGTIIWDKCQIRTNAQIGIGVMIGRNVFIDHNVRIGNYTRVQNNSLIYFPSILEEQVFIGPGVILTNDKYPRSSRIQKVNSDSVDWELAPIHIKQGASLGAGVICVGPLIISEWSMVAAGSTLTRDTVPFGLYVGSPAKRVGWVGHEGHTLKQQGNSIIYLCPKSNRTYMEVRLNCLEEIL